MSYIKRILGTSTLAYMVPFVALAQEGVGGADFVNSLSLWIAVIIGLIASIMVLMLGHKRMKGGLFGSVLKYLGVGMLLVVLGFLAVVVKPWASPFVIMRTHDVAFVIGYLLMLFGAWKLLKGVSPMSGGDSEQGM